jgi:hypothetical protein
MHMRLQHGMIGKEHSPAATFNAILRRNARHMTKSETAS